MSAYRPTLSYERPPLQRRFSGLALAVAVNLLLLLVLTTLSRFAPEAKKISRALVVDMLPESHSATAQTKAAKSVERAQTQPMRRPPPIVLPAKPTIVQPPKPPGPPFVEMSSADLAAADLRNVPKATNGDSEVVGKGPHGEVLYAAEWARVPTDAELSGYIPSNAPEGFGLVACKTIPGDRVEDCVELDQTPGSHLASAVRQAAWQFRVRPPRRNGVPMVGSWVSIRIDYEHFGRSSGL